MERGLVSKVVLIVVAHGNEANLTFCNQIAPRLAPMSGQCRRVNAAGSDRTKGEMPFLWPEHCSAEDREIRNPARDKPNASVESPDHGFDVDDWWVIHCADRLPRISRGLTPSATESI